MTQCWPEGKLRAYLDRELPAEDIRCVAAHLAECTACDNLCTELAARAAHVSALVELLDSPAVAARVGAWAPRPRPRPGWLPVGAAVALAAGLAIAGYLLPKHNPPPVAVIHAAPIIQAAQAIHVAPMTAVAEAVAAPPIAQLAPRRARSIRRAAAEPDYFVALDNEPFESGVIMRVDVKPGNVQADIVFGPDGRAHAFRLVNATQRNF